MSRAASDLAARLAAETGASADDLRPQVAANALIGVHRALIDYVRRRVLADDTPASLAADVRERSTEPSACSVTAWAAARPASSHLACAARR